MIRLVTSDVVFMGLKLTCSKLKLSKIDYRDSWRTLYWYVVFA